jgi:hypothetical protein
MKKRFRLFLIGFAGFARAADQANILWIVSEDEAWNGLGDCGADNAKTGYKFEGATRRCGMRVAFPFSRPSRRKAVEKNHRRPKPPAGEISLLFHL